jgi:hypothetical protein
MNNLLRFGLGESELAKMQPNRLLHKPCPALGIMTVSPTTPYAPVAPEKKKNIFGRTVNVLPRVLLSW